jgi:hypothetical protein
MRLSWLFLLLLATAAGCGQTPTLQPTQASNPKAEGQMVIKPGGIYSVKSGDGDFSIVKVLVVEDGGVHARLHKNRYKERPTSIDPKELQVAIGHVPLSEVGFRNWEPVLLLEQPVTDDELVGYRLWRDR